MAQRRPDTGLPERPRTRGECAEGVRPCPWVGCRYHLWLDVRRDGGLDFAGSPDVAHLDAMAQTCALDVADAGPQGQDAVGVLLGLTRQRMSGATMTAQIRLARYLTARQVHPEPPRIRASAGRRCVDCQASLDDYHGMSTRCVTCRNLARHHKKNRNRTTHCVRCLRPAQIYPKRICAQCRASTPRRAR